MDFLNENLSVIASTVAIFISYFLGQLSKTTDFKKNKLEERYYNFYIPFFTMLVRNRYPERPYSQIIPFDDFKILNHISNNLQYLDVESAGLFKNLYFYQLRIIEFSTGKYPDNERYLDLIDRDFNRIVELSYRESEYIAKKLRLKKVTKNIL